MFIGHCSIGYFYAGYCLYRNRDVEISFGLFPRRRPVPEGEIGVHVSASIAWNWPRGIYQRICWPHEDGLSSYAWTGREVRLVGVDFRYFWRSLRSSVTLIGWPEDRRPVLRP